MANVTSDVFEQIGGIAGGTAKQITQLPEEILNKAGQQVKGPPTTTSEQEGTDEESQSRGQVGKQKFVQQFRARAKNLQLQDRRLAEKRISEIRAAIASGNKQIIHMETAKAGKSATSPVTGPQIPPTPKLPPIVSQNIAIKQGSKEIKGMVIG